MLSRKISLQKPNPGTYHMPRDLRRRLLYCTLADPRPPENSPNRRLHRPLDIDPLQRGRDRPLDSVAHAAGPARRGELAAGVLRKLRLARRLPNRGRDAPVLEAVQQLYGVLFPLGLNPLPIPFPFPQHVPNPANFDEILPRQIHTPLRQVLHARLLFVSQSSGRCAAQ
jgi:hypothetical protein